MLQVQEKRNPPTLLVEIVIATIENSMEIS